MKRKIFTGILVIVTACLVLGCGKKEEGARKAEGTETESNHGKEAEKEEEEEEEEYQTIGEETGDALRILLTNQTGEEIIGLSVKASSAGEESENLLDKGMKIGKEETVYMYYTPEKADSEEDEKTRTTYDLSLSCADERVVEITGLELEDMEAAELCFEDEVGFVKYKSADSGKEISTKETALALKAQKQAKAAAEEKKKAEAEQAKKDAEAAAAAQAQKEAEAAAAQAQAEAAAQGQYEQQYYEQPTYQEPVYEEPVYQEPVYEEPVYEQPADSGGQDVGQSGESCLGGQGVLRY